MDHFLKQTIPFLKDASSIKKLTKGFSYDEKYVIDNRYLLRIFPSEELHKREKEFAILNELSSHSNFIPKGKAFDTLPMTNKAYMVLTFLPGEDGEATLPKLSKDESYSIGYSAGIELKKLHSLSAPEDYPSWFTVKKKKSDNYLSELQKLNMDGKIVSLLENYIWNHEKLMQGRLNSFQHDDIHPSNILIDNKRFSGIIDFQQMDWGDPIHDLQKLGFFSKRVSIEFTRGMIDGYHDGEQITESFWQLYTLYSAIHIVSALVWANKREHSHFKQILEYSLEVIEDHDNFCRLVPKWYQQ